MSLIFVTDARFYKTKSGKIYAGEFSYSDILWKRYLDYFGDVKVIGRLFHVESFKEESHEVSSIIIQPLVEIKSPIDFITKKNILNKELNKYFLNIKSEDCVIIRGAGFIAYSAFRTCKKLNIEFGLELIGDPYEVFAPGVMKNNLRPIMRTIFTRFQKKIALEAKSVLYVTKNSLQNRYPSNVNAFTTYASDVIVNNISEKPKSLIVKKRFKIISIGALNQMYKSPDDAIRLIKLLRDNGFDVELYWLGHGIFLEKMIQLAESLDIKPYVNFVGSVSNQEVIKHLDSSDIFILLSKTEGLPRAMIEAMSRGLPCIGTKVGGIPELIDSDMLVDVADYKKAVSIVEKLMVDNDYYYEISSSNLKKVKEEYDPFYLNKKRALFFNSLKRV